MALQLGMIETVQLGIIETMHVKPAAALAVVSGNAYPRFREIRVGVGVESWTHGAACLKWLGYPPF